MRQLNSTERRPGRGYIDLKHGAGLQFALHRPMLWQGIHLVRAAADFADVLTIACCLLGMNVWTLSCEGC